eukprot:1161736-Pelagomonas_calceolata.AAC.14
MVTERQNIASRTLIKGVSKGPLGAGIEKLEKHDNANKDWFQLLNQDIPEAHWLPLNRPTPATT